MPPLQPIADGLEAPRRFAPKPAWLKVRAPGGESYARTKRLVRSLGLHTVCEEARCPNVGECWGCGTATLMLLGEACTRGCRFCDVRSSASPPPPDPDEPRNVASAVAAMGLRHVVLTMVDRDDLPRGGADHVAETVKTVKDTNPEVTVELLTGDFQGDPKALELVARSGAEVLAHNVETVERLQREVRDARCGFELSLEVLRRYKALAPRAVTKSGLMLGLGESDLEVEEAFRALRACEVDILTLGQYLQPSPRHLQVREYVTPERFSALGERALECGFRGCASGPLVRSSYRAAELYLETARQARGGPR